MGAAGRHRWRGKPTRRAGRGAAQSGVALCALLPVRDRRAPFERAAGPVGDAFAGAGRIAAAGPSRDPGRRLGSRNRRRAVRGRRDAAPAVDDRRPGSGSQPACRRGEPGAAEPALAGAGYRRHVAARLQPLYRRLSARALAVRTGLAARARRVGDGRSGSPGRGAQSRGSADSSFPAGRVPLALADRRGRIPACGDSDRARPVRARRRFRARGPVCAAAGRAGRRPVDPAVAAPAVLVAGDGHQASVRSPLRLSAGVAARHRHDRPGRAERAAIARTHGSGDGRDHRKSGRTPAAP
jgi:hypothetical protein